MKNILFAKLINRDVWLTIPEVAEHVLASTTVLREKIIQLLTKEYSEGIVRTITLPNGNQVYFINKYSLQLFTELSGLTLRKDAEKTDDWLDSNDIFKFVYCNKSKIITYIYKYKKTHRDSVQHKLLNGKKVICLNIKNKDDFIKKYKLTVRTDKEWLGAYDLKKQFITQYCDILKSLRTFAPQYPTKIKYTKHHSNMTLCVRYDFVNQFAELANLRAYSPMDKKTSDWLTAQEIEKNINRDHNSILNTMRQLYAEHNPMISLKLNIKRWSLCVHKNNLHEFLTQTGILTPAQIENNQQIAALFQHQR